MDLNSYVFWCHRGCWALESAGPPARLKPFPFLFLLWSLPAEEGALRVGTLSAEEGAQEPGEGSAPGLGLELG